MRILLLEDDVVLSDIIAEYLESHGFEVMRAEEGEEALVKAYEEHFDLLLLDVKVPVLRGFDVLRMLRQRGVATPAIFITSLSRIEDLSSGFEAGCDDYIRKPFELKELLLRIKNLQKRPFSHMDSKTLKICSDVVFDIERDVLIKNQKEIVLQNKELRALKALLKNRGKVVSYDDLIRAMWDFSEEPSFESLRTHIKNLRKAMGEDIIINIRGIGYRLDECPE